MSITDDLDPASLWPIELPVTCDKTIFAQAPVHFERWAPLNYLVGPNGSGKTTLFTSIMGAARAKWPKKVKILGTGRLGPLEKSVSPWVGDTAAKLFAEDNLDSVYRETFSGKDTSHSAFQILEKRLDLQIRVLGFLRHVFKRSIYLKSTRKGLQVLGVTEGAAEYHIIDECHGLKELITLLTFLYDETFAVLGIDEPELHLHPQFQRFLLDEMRAVAGNPEEKGKKLIFLVTHSPVLLDLRHLRDVSSVVVFSGDSSSPKRAELSEQRPEALLKLRQALPAFHSTQRELIFSASPVVTEGYIDAAILLNLATRMEIPLGAAGIGVASMGGRNQLFAFRTLLTALAKPRARFILDLDAMLDAQVLHALDEDGAVRAFLANAGTGGTTISQEAGSLKTLLRDYTQRLLATGSSIGPFTPDKLEDLSDRELAVILRILQKDVASGSSSFDATAVLAIAGKCELIRGAARAGNVLILKQGPIEAYYKSPPAYSARDFEKQLAFQGELDRIWTSTEVVELEARYSELLDFVREAGLLRTPTADVVREHVANLIHLLQSEVAAGRITDIAQAHNSSRAKAEGYWHVGKLAELDVRGPNLFSGTIETKAELGGDVFQFDQNTRAYGATSLPTPAQSGRMRNSDS